MSSYSYEWTTRLLKRLGLTNLAELDECISPYDDDKISRIIWGSRQGPRPALDGFSLGPLTSTIGKRVEPPPAPGKESGLWRLWVTPALRKAAWLSRPAGARSR